MTTQAQRFLVLWHSQERTISTAALARRIDPNLQKLTVYNPYQATYMFSDGSTIVVTGRGRHHTIHLSHSPESEPTYVPIPTLARDLDRD